MLTTRIMSAAPTESARARSVASLLQASERLLLRRLLSNDGRPCRLSLLAALLGKECTISKVRGLLEQRLSECVEVRAGAEVASEAAAGSQAKAAARRDSGALREEDVTMALCTDFGKDVAHALGYRCGEGQRTLSEEELNAVRALLSADRQRRIPLNRAVALLGWNRQRDGDLGAALQLACQDLDLVRESPGRAYLGLRPGDSQATRARERAAEQHAGVLPAVATCEGKMGAEAAEPTAAEQPVHQPRDEMQGSCVPSAIECMLYVGRLPAGAGADDVREALRQGEQDSVLDVRMGDRRAWVLLPDPARAQECRLHHRLPQGTTVVPARRSAISASAFRRAQLILGEHWQQPRAAAVPHHTLPSAFDCAAGAAAAAAAVDIMIAHVATAGAAADAARAPCVAKLPSDAVDDRSAAPLQDGCWMTLEACSPLLPAGSGGAGLLACLKEQGHVEADALVAALVLDLPLHGCTGEDVDRACAWLRAACARHEEDAPSPAGGRAECKVTAYFGDDEVRAAAAAR